MPLYEYRCTVCNHLFEVHHEVGGAPGPCPVCGGTPRRIFTSVGLIFKGSGFHTTDYRKPSASEESRTKDAPARAREGEAAGGTDGAGARGGGTGTEASSPGR